MRGKASPRAASVAPAATSSLAAVAAGMAAALVLLSASRTALADAPSATRAVAVLEYRAGSSALSGIDRRAAAILSTKTSLQVVDADAARKRYGDRLDSHVAKCRGDAACIAQIGGVLSVDEVLLVGVSEFGDVIVTFQRIGASGEVTARIAEALAADARPSDADIEQYVRRVLPESDFVRWGTIKITANLEGAVVFVGGDERGTTPVKPLRVRAPKRYDIRVTKPGFTPFEAEVMVPPDAQVDVKSVLVRGGEDVPWYKRWWVVAIAGAVVTGAAVGIVATRGGGDEVPVTIDPFP